MGKPADLTLTLELKAKDVKANLEAIGESVKKLGLETEATFAKRQGKGVLGIDDKQVKSNLEAIGESVKRLGLVTESTFAKQNMALLGVRNFAEVKAEMASLTTAYRDLAASGKASAGEQAKALESLRAKQRELYALMSNPPKLQSARDVLGVKSQAETVSEINKVKSAYKALADSGKLSIGELANAKRALNARIDEINGKVKTSTTLFGKMGGVLAGVFAVGAIAGYGNLIRKVADEYQNLRSRLQLTTKSGEELQAVQDGLYRISQLTGTRYAANANVYAQLALSMKDVGMKSKETLNITELVNKSLIINGSSTGMASSFMLQFSQAMGSGVLQGEEFRAMMESNGYFAGLLAKALDTDIGGLRSMSKEGKLTTDLLRSAFPKMANEINAAFEKIPPTTQRAVTVLQNAYYRIIDDSNKAANGTGSIALEITKLADTIDRNRAGIISLFSLMISGSSKAVGWLGDMGTELEVIKAVGDGRLGLFKYLGMDMEEMNAWLKSNIKEIDKTGSALNGNAAAGKAAYGEIAAAGEESANDQAGFQKKATDAMKKAYQSYADTVKKLQDDIAGREQDLAAQLREMGRSGMLDAKAWQDRKREAEEYATAAKRAAEEAKQAFAPGGAGAAVGQSKAAEAVNLYDKARGAAAELNREIKAGDTVIASQQQNLKTAMSLVEGYGRAGIEVQKNLEQAIKDSANALNEQSGGALVKEMPEVAKQFGEVVEKADSLAKKSEEFNAAWNAAWDDFLEKGTKDIYDLDNRLEELTKDRNITVHVREVVEKSTGGVLGYMRGGLIQALATGGTVVRNILAGGFLPGFGGGDTVPLMGERGEVMINKDAVAEAGLPAALAFNSRRWDVVISELLKITGGGLGDILGYRFGGIIDSMPSLPALSPQHLAAGGSVGDGAFGDTINLTVNSYGSSTQADADRVAKTVINTLQKWHRGRS